MILDSDSENNCEYVCSRGILKSCGLHSQEPISSIQYLHKYPHVMFEPGMSIYVASTALPDFINTLESIPDKFVLVSGDCDICVPTDIFKSHKEFIDFIENPKIIHWYSQNCTVAHPKITQIPIGLDYHTISNANNHSWGDKMTPKEQETMLKTISSSASPVYERTVACYSNFHFAMTTRFAQDRSAAIAQVPAELVYYEPEQITREQSWRNQAKYAFVLSPHGNGLDCHRTWEALCLGCIPIVKTSPLDSLYAGLPVLIVNEWNEINHQLLTDIINRVRIMNEQKQFQYEKLTLQYWTNKINAQIIPASPAINSKPRSTNMHPRICFITAIYGNYETSCKKFVNQTVETDFICFTDNKNIISNGWIIDTTPYHLVNKSKLDTDLYVNSLSNNKHTFNIAKYYKQSFKNIPILDKYDVIVWLDGTIEIIYDKTSEYILNNIYKEKIIGWHHEDRNGVLMKEVIASHMERYTSTFWNNQRQPYQDVDSQYRFYLSDGYDDNTFFKKLGSHTPHMGVWITCFVAFLVKDPEVIQFLDLWYLQTLKYTTQDQIGFPYVCQKTGIIPFTLPNNAIWGNRPHSHTMFYIKHNHGR